MWSRDTSPLAGEAHARWYRRLPPARRVALAVEMSEETRSVTLAGIRARHPGYSGDQARLALFRLLFGDDIYRRAWPAAPMLAP